MKKTGRIAVMTAALIAISFVSCGKEKNSDVFYVGDVCEKDTMNIYYVESGEYNVSERIREDGYKYIYLKFLFEANNKEGMQAVIPGVEFECKIDGKKCEELGVNEFSSYELYPEKAAYSGVVFKVPEDTERAEINYKRHYRNEEAETFIYSGENKEDYEYTKKIKKSENALKPGETATSKEVKIEYVDCGEMPPSINEREVAKGYRVIYTEFNIENISDKDIDNLPLHFTCYADGLAFQPKSNVKKKDEIKYKLPIGKETKGKIFYLVPEDAKCIEIYFNYESLINHPFVFSYKE